MRHENSVFHQIQKHIDWSHFDQLVDKHKADYRVRRLTTKNQFLALLFGQLSGMNSLRGIEAGFASHQDKLYHVGGRTIARTTLADANAKRPSALYEEMFAHMIAKAGRAMRRHMKDAIRLLDATRIPLSSLSNGWADVVNGKTAIKLHIAYDPLNHLPHVMDITGQRTNDLVPAKAMTIVPNTTYVFDMAYYNFEWWAKLHANNCRFVTRLKSHTHLHQTDERPLPDSAPNILADRTGYLSPRMARSRLNPFQDRVREITVRIDNGKIIRVVSNDLEADAVEIAGFYKQRWQIELFFKWIKQNLKLDHFTGTSANAVRIQIFVALIACLILHKAKQCQSNVGQTLKFCRLVTLNLMHRRDINQLLKPPQTHKSNRNQMEMML